MCFGALCRTPDRECWFHKWPSWCFFGISEIAGCLQVVAGSEHLWLVLEFRRESFEAGSVGWEWRLALMFSTLLVNLSQDFVRGETWIIEDEERVVWIFTGEWDWLCHLTSTPWSTFEVLSLLGRLRSMKFALWHQLFRKASERGRKNFGSLVILVINLASWLDLVAGWAH